MEKKLKYDINDFVGVFQNAVKHSWCDKLIEEFEYIQTNHPKLVMNRQANENAPAIVKKNDFIFLNQHLHERDNQTMYDYFMDTFISKIFPIYFDKYYSINTKTLKPEAIKIQKTLPGEGYHQWHYEQFNAETSKRVLVYMIYLNDVEEGGETELLYYHKRIKPKKGTVLLFPPGFTHTHRGNPPLSGVKYAVTGWLCLDETKVPQTP